MRTAASVLAEKYISERNSLDKQIDRLEEQLSRLRARRASVAARVLFAEHDAAGA